MTNSVPIGVYIHIPFCKSRCAYCSFISSTDMSRQQLYVNSLVNEIRLRAKGQEVDSVYIGGGTPSMLASGLLSQIFNALKQGFVILPSAEITIEANPDSFSLEFASECVAQNVNRLSLGLQSTNDVILKNINRPHKYVDFLQALSLAQRVKIKNISCDLMLGLPQDDLLGVKESLKKVINLPIKHLSVYALKIEEGTPLFSSFAVNEDLQADMYDLCYKLLNQNGFNRYEVSNFARVGYESKHNLKYWKRLPYLGFGVAAHSFFLECRYENTSDISKYILGDYEPIVNEISTVEQAEEYIMLSLRTSYGIDFNVAKQYGVDLEKTKSKQIDKLLKLNMIETTPNGIVLAKNAYYVMNSIILELI